jgi:dihydroflavonol-4-reductase
VKYLLTGATGFVGGALAHRLLDNGHTVHVLARDTNRALDLAGRGAKVFEGDITSRDSLRRPMEGVDGVFHAAAWYHLGARHRGAAYRANVDGTRNVLQTMRELSIPRGVYTSTIAVFSNTHEKLVDETYRYDGPHLSEYDRTKWLAHYEVALPMIADGLPLVIVQPGAVYGPGDRSDLAGVMKAVIRGKQLFISRGTKLCWTHIDDVVDGHVRAMEQGRVGESYILAGPVHELEDVVCRVAALAGHRPPPLRFGPGALTLMAALMKPLAAIVPLPPAFTPEAIRAVAGVSYIASSAKATAELGCRFRSLEEGLPGTVEWLR